MKTDQEIIKVIKETQALSLPEHAELLTKYLTKQSVMQVALVEMALTPTGSIQNGLQINKHMEINGGRDSMKLIIMLVENTAMFYNVNKNITEHQHVQIAQAIIEKYGYDNIEDVIIALKNGRSGMYGKLYGRFDGEVVLDWIAQYMESKAEAREKLHHQRKTELLDVAPNVIDAITKQIPKLKKPPAIVNVSIKDEITGPDRDRLIQEFEAVKSVLKEHDLMKYATIFRNPENRAVYADQIEWIENRIVELRTNEVRKGGSK